MQRCFANLPCLSAMLLTAFATAGKPVLVRRGDVDDDVSRLLYDLHGTGKARTVAQVNQHA